MAKTSIFNINIDDCLNIFDLYSSSPNKKMSAEKQFERKTITQNLYSLIKEG